MMEVTESVKDIVAMQAKPYFNIYANCVWLVTSLMFVLISQLSG